MATTDLINWTPALEPSGDGAIETDFEYFPGGSILDLIRPKHSRGLSLVLYGRGSTIIADNLEYAESLYVPPSDPILKRIHFSRHIASNASRSTFDGLFKEIPTFLEQFFDFSARADSSAASLFGLGTWFTHRTPVAPYLSIVGPPGSGKTQLARCLSYICRRGLLVSDLT